MIKIKDITEEYYKHNYILCCDKDNKVIALYALEIILEYNEYSKDHYCIYSNDNKFKEEYDDIYNLIYSQELDNYTWYSVREEELIENKILIPEQWNYKNIGKLSIL